ncbi:hypothetical protein [Bacillus pumilus]|uniref:hypothetical protein n=1 Tax=Bacillus pumilus TaxID=1408 RepID=UPI0015D52D0A|nr:hypothetical protein [Bacillus pumilus]QLI77115.1 hypothetical protein HZ310_04530 [Bacillus pumilus]
MAALKGVKTLDMVNGEITKVAYEGSEYERVEGDAKVGDLVLCTDVTWCDATEGAFYLSIAKGPVIVDDVDDKYRYYSDVYTLFRKKPTRLKVGDYAKVVDAADHRGLAEGDFVRISEDDESDIPFYCDVLSGELAKNSVWMREKKLAHATEDEVKAAKEAEAKRSIEAKWAKIGRKVDEYKVGDIVAHANSVWFRNSGLGEVAAEYKSGIGPIISAIDYDGYLVKYDVPTSKLTLITPVEARFDRS